MYVTGCVNPEYPGVFWKDRCQVDFLIFLIQMPVIIFLSSYVV